MAAKVRIGTVIVLFLGLVVALGIFLLGGGDGAGPANPGGQASSEPTRSTPSSTPSPDDDGDEEEPAAAPECEGPDTILNLDGVRAESLLPDCGARVVSREEQTRSGLDLGCGGRHPVILYKSTTSGAQASVCGRNSSGEDFRLVVKPDGGDVLDLKGRYDPQNDAFIGDDGDTEYAIIGYDGSLVVTGADGTSRTQESDGDWVSLDNEPDGD